MRAVVLSGPRTCAVEGGPVPGTAPGEVVGEAERVGVCGTDVELFTGELSYLQTGHSSYPLRPGHEWCGRVTEVGDGVDAGWLGPPGATASAPAVAPGGSWATPCSATGAAGAAAAAGSTCEHRQEVGIRGGR